MYFYMVILKNNFITGEEPGNPLQYCCLKTLMGRGTGWATVHRSQKGMTEATEYAHT